MGGLGSGSWYRWQSRKSTVEEYLALDTAHFKRLGIPIGPPRAGTWIWRSRGTGKVSSRVAYDMYLQTEDAGIIQVSYRNTRTKESFNYPIRLVATRPHFGGLRWWFICPVVTNDRPCRRRVRKLYLGGRYFGCRHCFDLTYTSSQEAHKDERMALMMNRWAALERLGGRDSDRSPGQLMALLRMIEYENGQIPGLGL